MTRYTAALLSLLLLFGAFIFSTFADDTTDDLMSRLPPEVTHKIIPKAPAATASASTCYSWYCRHMKDGVPPPCPDEMEFISDHGGYFIGDPGEKVIYLTFDAGYENGNVSKILDTLRSKGVSAAFFILENLCTRSPELVRRMAEEGHLVCNHTATHRDVSSCDDEVLRDEVSTLNAALADIGVECAPFFRPPEGKFSKKSLDSLSQMGYSTVFWSFAYADWDNAAQPDPASSLQKLLEGTHNGMVLLLHPTSSTNAEILGELIDRWKEMGYTFGTLTELTEGGKGE